MIKYYTKARRGGLTQLQAQRALSGRLAAPLPGSGLVAGQQLTLVWRRSFVDPSESGGPLVHEFQGYALSGLRFSAVAVTDRQLADVVVMGMHADLLGRK